MMSFMYQCCNLMSQMGDTSLLQLPSCLMGQCLIEVDQILQHRTKPAGKAKGRRRLAEKSIWFIGADTVLSMTLGSQSQFCAMPRSS